MLALKQLFIRKSAQLTSRVTLRRNVLPNNLRKLWIPYRHMVESVHVEKVHREDAGNAIEVRMPV